MNQPEDYNKIDDNPPVEAVAEVAPPPAGCSKFAKAKNMLLKMCRVFIGGRQNTAVRVSSSVLRRSMLAKLEARRKARALLMAQKCELRRKCGEKERVSTKHTNPDKKKYRSRCYTSKSSILPTKVVSSRFLVYARKYLEKHPGLDRQHLMTMGALAWSRLSKRKKREFVLKNKSLKKRNGRT